MLTITLRKVVLLVFISQCQAAVNVVNAISNFTSRQFQERNNPTKDFIQMATENGYRAEKHQVTTEDGYILTMFRIPPGSHCTKKSNSPKKTQFLLMHGLLQAAEGLLDSGPDAPGYIIADECYDTWFGNIRGNYNTRQHVSLDPDTDLKFWKFSVDEMGLYDIPAMIDYVLAATNKKKLIYLGYSQGGGTFLIMNSERPEYADKVSLFVGLSPAAKLTHTRSIAGPIFATVNAFEGPLEAAGIWEVLSVGLPIQGVASFLCQVEMLAAFVCGSALAIIDSPHPDSVTPDIDRRLVEHAPAGTSIQNLAWYGQAKYNPSFLKFSYGVEKNLELYGSPDPPEYNLKAVTMPTVIFHGLSDLLVDRRDMNWVVSQLPNVLEYVKVPDPLWNHMDMGYSRYWRQTIFVPMKKYLDKYDNLS